MLGRFAVRPLFTVGSHTYDLRDVVAAAVVRRDWCALEDQARQGIACVRQARDRGVEPLDADVAQATDEFRRALGLFTVEETEEWLDGAGVRFGDWTAYLERLLLRRRWAGELDAIACQHAVTDAELAECLYTEAACSGALTRFGETLAVRAAMGERTRVEAPASQDHALDHREACARRCAALFGQVAGAESAGADWRARVTLAIGIEGAYQATVARSVTPAVVRAQIHAQHLAWTQVCWRYLTLPDEDAAREAALCIRHEGASLDAVATRAATRIHREQPFLEDLDLMLRPAVLSAQPSELLGPLTAADGFRIAVVDRKIPPSPDDAAVRTRARTAVIEGLEVEAQAQVHWHQRLLRT